MRQTFKNLVSTRELERDYCIMHKVLQRLETMTDVCVSMSTDDEHIVVLVCAHLCECVSSIFTLALMKEPSLR